MYKIIIYIIKTILVLFIYNKYKIYLDNIMKENCITKMYLSKLNLFFPKIQNTFLLAFLLSNRGFI